MVRIETQSGWVIHYLTVLTQLCVIHCLYAHTSRHVIDYYEMEKSCQTGEWVFGALPIGKLRFALINGFRNVLSCQYVIAH